MSRLRDRSTPDVIVILLTGVVGIVILTVTFVMIVAVLRGNTDAARQVFKTVGELTNGLIALIVGYVAGRGIPPDGDNKK